MAELDFMDEDGEDKKMAGSAWTTQGEYTFLQRYLPEYQDLYAQDGNRRDKYLHFWKKLHEDWFAQYPENERLFPGISRTDLTETQREAVKKGIQSRKKSLTSWFRWRPTESSINKAATRGINRRADKKEKAKLAGVPTSRKKNVGEVYSKLFYTDKIAPLVKAHIDALPPGTKFNNGDRLVLVNKIAKDLYEEADEETQGVVLKEVDRLHQANVDQLTDLSNGNRTPEQYHEAIIRLPNSLTLELQALAVKTGFQFSVFGGGPIPEKKGQISVFSFHIGGVDGVNRFGESKDFDAIHMTPFHRYVESAYPPEVRQSRALTETTPNLEASSSKHPDGSNDMLVGDVEPQMGLPAVVNHSTSTHLNSTSPAVASSSNAESVSQLATTSPSTAMGSATIMPISVPVKTSVDAVTSNAFDTLLVLNTQRTTSNARDNGFDTIASAEKDNQVGVTIDSGTAMSASNIVNTGLEDVSFMDLMQNIGPIGPANPNDSLPNGLFSTNAYGHGDGGGAGSSQLFANIPSSSIQHNQPLPSAFPGSHTHQDRFFGSHNDPALFDAHSNMGFFSMFNNLDDTPRAFGTPSTDIMSVPSGHFLPAASTYTTTSSAFTTEPSAFSFTSPANGFTPCPATFTSTSGCMAADTTDRTQALQLSSKPLSRTSSDEDQNLFFSQLNAISGYQLPPDRHNISQNTSSTTGPAQDVSTALAAGGSPSTMSSNGGGTQLHCLAASSSHNDAVHVPVIHFLQGVENSGTSAAGGGNTRRQADSIGTHDLPTQILESTSHGAANIGCLQDTSSTVPMLAGPGCGGKDLGFAQVEQGQVIESENATKLPVATASTRSGRPIVPSKRNDQMSKIGTKDVSVIERPMLSTDKDNDISAWAILTKDYLLLTDLGDNWRNCVNAWFELETMLGFGTASGTKNPLPGSSTTRPLEWLTWTRSGRKLENVPAIGDSAEFGLAISRWWYSMQPEFRRTTEDVLSPLNCSLEPGNGPLWAPLAKAGQNGMVSLMMLMVWWKRAMANRTIYDEDSHTKWALVVKDVTDVLSFLRSMGPQAFKVSTKRKPTDLNGDDDFDGGSKRAKKA